ncbi:MAG: hypothetical protein OXG44_13720 [Gammaproteobacteria bacterium]|nr:hypothetical protein [Gammaproteobacteria bacterium]
MLALAKTVRARESRIAELESEHRTYTSIVTDALVNAAADTVADGYIAALETAAGQLSRAFAAAQVSGPGADAFSPWTMAQIGRALVEDGEAVWYRIGQRLRRADNYELEPRGVYRLSLPGGLVAAAADRVFHARWNIDVNSLRGVGPLTTARNLRLLMQRLEGSIGDELNAAVGYLLPIPSDGDAETITTLKTDLAALKGRIAVIETARAGWGQGPAAAPRYDFMLSRLGPDIPDAHVRLFETARDSVLSACGLPVALAGAEDGTAQREAWRRYLHGTVSPLGRLVAEAAAGAGLPITLGWDALFASDIAGRARAFQSLVGAGMPLAEAAAASGILTMEEG